MLKQNKVVIFFFFALLVTLIIFFIIKTRKENDIKAYSFVEIIRMSKMSKSEALYKSKSNNSQSKTNLAENTFCDFYDYVNRVDYKTSTFTIQNLKPAVGFSENRTLNLNNLLSWDNKTLEISHNEIDIFFSMLLKSDLLDGVSSNEINLEEALYFANLLIEKGRENSIYYLIRAIIKEKLNYPQEQVNQDLISAFNIKNFDTYTMTISRELMKRGLNDKDAFMMVQNIFVNLPVLKYTTIISIVNRFIDSNENNEQTNQAFLWSEKILKNNIKFAKYEHSDYLFRMAAEFYMAKSIYTNAFKKINGEDKNDSLTQSLYAQSSKDTASIFQTKSPNCEEHLNIVYNQILNTMIILEN